MADYTDSKDSVGLLSPSQTVAAGFSRYEPLITGEAMVERFLTNIDLSDPRTKKPMPAQVLNEQILDAIAVLEMEVGLQIFPTQHRERQAFDRNLYATMGYMMLEKRPVMSIESLTITASNNVDLWTVSNDWIDTGRMAGGQIYIVPINVAVTAQMGGGASGGAAFLAILGQQSWVPAYWMVTYTTGFKDGKLPRAVNVLVGIQAAIQVLGLLAAARAAVTSKSIGMDGLSQSSSGPGPQMYDTVIKLLMDRKKVLVGKMKNQYGLKMFSGNV